ncbi:hypothetical protein [Mucilaginibacter glaciei]|uniref:Protochlamydia outer membrane protein domain-containing protein n=1 Tax=Mucilaginibacter glaciei TaxID=2772109 RepID=A0A926S0I7_9SPHI|nr:hypothetical protein [Mucilaginibacter glaciei]MBD1392048.1 hypothetical protein [Mucilaginibacter glaciei]
MIRFLITCCLFLLATGILRAQSPQNKLHLSLLTGYERQDLNWSIAGNATGQNPNIYSELKWRNVGGQTASAAIQWDVWHHIVLSGNYSRTFITTGIVTDNDYNGDNRTSPAYAMTFDADRGSTQAINLGLGYPLIQTTLFKLTPFAGYGINKQSLHLLDNTGNFADLNSTYETSWKGPFLRTSAEFRLTQKIKLIGDVTYHQVNYNASANWNLIPSFQHPVSYRHNAKGYGLDGNVYISYDLAKHVALNIGAAYFTFQTGKGVDELYLNSGGSEKTQLNGVDNKGYRLFGGLLLRY